MSESDRTNDWTAVQAALVRVGEHLRHPARLVLIGSTVGMWYGQPGRMTEDVDVWSPKSQADLADIAQACEKAGIVFDPRGDDVTGLGLYIQMVTPGVVHVGKWRTEHSMFTTGKLEVVHPPAENIVAAKLVRGAAHDIEDIAFLMRRLHVSMERVHEVIASFPHSARVCAEENIIFLELPGALTGGAEQFLGVTKQADDVPQPEAASQKTRRLRP